MTRIGQTTQGGGNENQLSTSDGSTKWILRDSDGFVVFSVDSKGNIRHRGKIGRVARP